MEAMSFLQCDYESAPTISNIEDSTDAESDAGILENKRNNSCKRKESEDLIIDVLKSMKRKYDVTTQRTSNFSSFFEILQKNLEELPKEIVNETEIEILQLVNSKKRDFV